MATVAATERAALAVGRTPPPSPSSPFAALLRRSKFASYDPAVGQVYTAYGGNAYRGNYGFKRPITLKKRKQYITVQAVDSREQQTEWHRAESEARWMQRWDELGTVPKVNSSSPWDKQLGGGARSKWVLDSEFGKGAAVFKPTVEEVEVNLNEAEEGAVDSEVDVEAAEEKADTSSHMQKVYTNVVPNIERMHPKEFERYLQRLREQRPAFLAFLKEEAERERERRANLEVPDGSSRTTVTHDPSDVATSAASVALRRRFLSARSHEQRYGNPESQDLEPQPHRAAGATYAHESPLTQFFLTKPKLGRYLNMEWQPSMTRASLAGMAVYFDSNTARTADDRREAIPLRVTEAYLSAPPTPHKGLQSTQLTATVVDTTSLEMLRANPHRPGTSAYIAHGDPVKSIGKRAGSSMMYQVTKPATRKLWFEDKKKKKDDGKLVNFLQELLNAEGGGGSA